MNTPSAREDGEPIPVSAPADLPLEPLVEPPNLEIPPVTKQYLRSMLRYWAEGNRFFFTDGSAVVELSVLSDEIFRVRLAPEGQFLNDFSYAVLQQQPHTSHVSVVETADYVAVSTCMVRCQITKSDFRFSFYNENGVLINHDLLPLHWEENVAFGGYYVYATKQCQSGEGFFGLGDKPMELNRAGRRFRLWATDAYQYERYSDPLYKSIPFYIGLHAGMAYGIFFDNTFPTYFDFGHEDPHATSFWSEGGEMNYYFIYGPTMADVVRRYSWLTGTMPMPPLWALGYHQSRWSYYPAERVKEVVDTFRRKKIPCDVLHLDIDYMDGYRCFTWNHKLFPAPKKMIEELGHRGCKVVTIIDPGIKVDENYWVYQQGNQHNHFCRRSDDYFMEGHVWPGRCRFPDFTRKQVRQWWGGLFRELVDQGVTGIWCDMNEPAVFGMGTFPLDVRHDYDGFDCSHRKAHNVYGMQMARATYDGLRQLRPNKRPFVITRAGFAGTQRYACTWTGDNQATWDHLKLAAQMLQSLSLSGWSFAGSDIGGFTGSPDSELFLRWMQLGVFSPFMRVHSAGNTGQREPWVWGARMERMIKKTIELRYRLLPYIYSVFWEQSRYGLPVLRPLILLEPDNWESLRFDDCFCFGDKLLIAPVTERGVSVRPVYLPKGWWYQYCNLEFMEGGRIHEAYAPLDIVPIFVKAGSVIPEWVVRQYVGERNGHSPILSVYYGRERTESIFYEDHGDTFAYDQGVYAEKKFQVWGSDTVLVMEQQIDGLFEPPYDFYRLRIIGLPFAPAKVMLDSRVVRRIRKVPNKNILVLDIPKNFSRLEIRSEGSR